MTPESPNARRWPTLLTPSRGAAPPLELPGASVAPLPIAPIRLRPDGRCGCRACLADDQRADAAKDRALASIVFDLGNDQLRQAALARVPAFVAAFEAAS